ncbi:MAG: von Willebrand factor type A domain-containing protein [Elusimicrobium sp.]|jgi:Ca-activated chloride channel family protein|nr:von Willebrand factor type A domain-containing protein [Elusimicrobium sp.]
MNKKLLIVFTILGAALLSSCYDKEDIDAFKKSYQSKPSSAQPAAATAAAATAQSGNTAAAAQIAPAPVGSFWTGNDFQDPLIDRYSYFPPYVGTDSYPNIKNFVFKNQRPSEDIVQTEEIVNYFPYNYPAPDAYSVYPASIVTEYTDCPWNAAHKLVKIGVRAKDPAAQPAPPENLVFLIDISGSMGGENKLSLVKQSFPFLLQLLRDQDVVSVVTYAKDAQVQLEGLNGTQKEKIMQTVAALKSGGRTAGSAGIDKAYEIARKYFLQNGNNRVILATDGYFNIGPSSITDLESQIAREKDNGVSLSVLGYGMGNMKDANMQSLADKGAGTYNYINNAQDAETIWKREFAVTVLVKQLLARDVKFKVEVNPVKVESYRLIGYKRKYNSAGLPFQTAGGDWSSGQELTALYEINPRCLTCAEGTAPSDSVYDAASPRCQREVMTVKMLYTDPASGAQSYIEAPVNLNSFVNFDLASEDTRFAASAAQFGQILENNKYKGSMTIDDVLRTANNARTYDPQNMRVDFLQTANAYRNIK